MSAQVAAHERYLEARRRLDAALADGDTRAAGRLRTNVEKAKRRWHVLVREAERAATRRRG